MHAHRSKRSLSKQPDSPGLQLGELSLSTPPRNGLPVFHSISQIIVVILGLLGASYCFITMFQISHYKGTLIFGSICFAVLAHFLLSNKTATKIGLPILAVLLGLALWAFRALLVEGFIMTANYMVWRINARMGWNLYDYVSNCPYSMRETVVTIFFLFLLFVFTFVLSWAISRRQSLLAVLVLTLPPLFAGLYFWLIPAYVPLVMLVSCWVSVAGMRVMRARRGRKHKSNGFFLQISKRKPHLELCEPASIRPVSVRVTAILLCITLLCSGTLALIFPKQSYQQPESVQHLRESLTNFFNQLSTQSVFSNVAASGGISEGKLGNVGKLNFQNTPALTIYMEHPSQQYLRGWIGSEYTGRGWNALSDSVYQEHQDTFNQLSQRQFTPQMQTGLYWDMATSCYQPVLNAYGGYAPSANLSKMDITVLNANKNYLYTPYNLLALPENGTTSYDGAIRANGWFGQGSYTLDTYQQQQTTSYIGYYSSIPLPFAYTEADLYNGVPFSTYLNGIDTSLPQAENYIEGENLYRDFVHQNYTSISEETREIMNQFLARYPYEGWFPVTTETDSLQYIESVVNYVANTMRSCASYTIAPGKTPVGRDFVEYFLFENYRGYCTHFATTATLLFRALGIPARYVEGYVLTDTDIQDAMREQPVAEGQPLTITVNDDHAHAWAEIYLDVYGWIPIETTPGYEGLQSINLSGQNTPEPSEPPAASSRVSSAPSSAASSSSPSSSNSSRSSGISSRPASQVNPFGAWNSLLTVLLIVVLTIALLLLALVLRRRWVCKKRREVFAGPTNTAAIACYQYLVKLFAFDGVVYQGNSLLEYAAQVEAHQPYLQKGQFVELIRLVQKAKFSQHVLTDEETGRLIAFANDCATHLYEKYPFWKRLIFKYVHTLY